MLRGETWRVRAAASKTFFFVTQSELWLILGHTGRPAVACKKAVSVSVCPSVCICLTLCVQYRKLGARHLHTCTKGYAGSAILSPRQAPQFSASSQYNTMHCTLVPSMQKSWAGQSFGYSLNIPHKERSMISYTLWFWFHLNARSGQESWFTDIVLILYILYIYVVEYIYNIYLI